MKKGNRKAFYALLLLSLIILIGGTFAYFTDIVRVPNIFKTKPYSTEVKEEFVSPDNWLPGTTTDKKVFVKNTGEVDVAVRVSYTESWVSQNGTELSLKQGDNQAAIINFDNMSDWEKEGDYYYYKKKLSSGDSTNSFIKSVKFNEKIESDYKCVGEGLTKQCMSTGLGYDSATYTLTVNVETIQFDAYKDGWNTNVEIK